MSFSVDEELLRKCLQTGRPVNCRVLVNRFEVDGRQNIVEPGTNYTSGLIRVRVEYECDSRPFVEHLVFKVPCSSAHFEFLSRLGFYDKETYMYDKVLPTIGEMLSSAVVPRHFLTAPNQVLALEDLTAYGYRLKMKTRLNLEHSKCVLQALAMFHAASAKLHQQDAGLLVAASQETMCTRDMVDSTLTSCYPIVVDLLRRENVSARVLENFVAYEAQIRRSDVCQFPRNPGAFSVLNHGDLKTNNMMFKYEKADADALHPTAVKFLDYQTCRWNSPALDLAFFNIITADYQVLEAHGDQLIHLYLRTLNETLGRLGCECAYTEANYREDTNGCVLFQIFTLLWASFLDLREAIPRFDFLENNQLKEDEIEKIRNDEMFKNRFMKWFRHFEKLGYFK